MEQSGKGTNNNQTIFKIIIFMLIILALTLLAIVIIFFQPFSGDGKINSVDFEDLEITMISSEDSSRHKINIDLTLEFKQGTLNRVTRNTLKQNIEQICSQLDYSKAASRENASYVESALEEGLRELLEDNFRSVYIVRMVSDNVKIYDESKQEDPYKKMREQIFKNIIPSKDNK